MFITSAPSRLPASSNDAWVRVEASKNRLISVRPRSDARFFSIWRLSSTNSSARSSRPTMSSCESPSIPSKWRWLRTKEDFWAMFIKAGSIGAAARPGKAARQRSTTCPDVGGNGNRPLHSTLMPSSRTIFWYRSMSSLIRAANSAGVLPTAVNPNARQSLLDLGQRDDLGDLPRQQIDDRTRRAGGRHEADDQLGLLVLERRLRTSSARPERSAIVSRRRRPARAACRP